MMTNVDFMPPQHNQLTGLGNELRITRSPRFHPLSEAISRGTEQPSKAQLRYVSYLSPHSSPGDTEQPATAYIPTLGKGVPLSSDTPSREYRHLEDYVPRPEASPPALKQINSNANKVQSRPLVRPVKSGRALSIQNKIHWIKRVPTAG